MTSKWTVRASLASDSSYEQERRLSRSFPLPLLPSLESQLDFATFKTEPNKKYDEKESIENYKKPEATAYMYNEARLCATPIPGTIPTQL